jgi:PII-like signaling protein
MLQPLPQANRAKILRLHFSESDRYDGKPLHEAIVARCREMQIAGATVFRGLEGYGEAAEIHRPRLTTRDQPIVIVIVDCPENIDRFRPVAEEMINTGLVAVSEVEARRIARSRPASS